MPSLGTRRHSIRPNLFASGASVVIRFTASSTVGSPHGEPTGPRGLVDTPSTTGYFAADSAVKSSLGRRIVSRSTASRPPSTRTIATGSRQITTTTAAAGWLVSTRSTRLTQGCISNALASCLSRSGASRGSGISRLAFRRACHFRSVVIHGGTPISSIRSAVSSDAALRTTPSRCFSHATRPAKMAAVTITTAPRIARHLQMRPKMLPECSDWLSVSCSLTACLTRHVFLEPTQHQVFLEQYLVLFRRALAHHCLDIQLRLPHSSHSLDKLTHHLCINLDNPLVQ